MSSCLLFVAFNLLLHFSKCTSSRDGGNCTYEISIQSSYDVTACSGYAETKAKILRKRIAELENILDQTPKDIGDNNKCEKEKNYKISYTDSNEGSKGFATVELTNKYVPVLCDLESDPLYGWIVIMQRFRRKGEFVENFNRTWEEYKEGFGEMGRKKEFWLGLEKLKFISNQPGKSFKLQITIVMKKPTIMKEYVSYDSFRVYGDHYTLQHQLDYSGSYHSVYDNRLYNLKSDRNFVTFDHQDDVYARYGYRNSYANCANLTAAIGGGGWWFSSNPYCQSYSKCNSLADTCGGSNLNAKKPFWSGTADILAVQMKIREN